MKKLKQYLFKYLFNGITDKDILKIDSKGVLYQNGKKLSSGLTSALINDAIRFEESELWKFMKNEVRYIANKHIFEKSTNTDDLMWGKTILYTVDLQEQLVARLKKIAKA